MSIYDTSPRKTYAVGATAQASFAVPFAFWKSSDLKVYVGDVLQTTGYTVSGGDGAGGTVTLSAAVANTTVAIIRRLRIERTTDFPNAGPLKTPAVNRQLDQYTAMLQQLDDDGARALRVPENDPATGAALPPLEQRAGRVLGFDADGKPVVSTSSIAQLDALTLAAMQAGKVAEVIEPFEADGTTSTITTAAPLVAAAQVTLLVGGIVQTPQSGAYTVAGNTITLAEPPPAGVRVGGYVGYAAEVAGDALTAIQGTTPAADRLPYFTGEAAASTTPLTAFARSLLTGASAAAMRSTLGLGTTDGVEFGAVSVSGDMFLGPTGILRLRPGDPTAGPGGGAYDGGILAQQVSGDGQVCAHQVQPTSGTLPPWGPITEYVAYRRGGSAVDFNRISLTGMADYAGPALNDPAADFRLQQEASGTVPAAPIRITTQVNDTGSLIFFVTFNPDGTIQLFERTDGPAPTGNNLELALKASKRALSNVLTSAGTQDSPGFRQTGAAYDTTLHSADWRSRVAPTSNAGASKWVMATRIDNASYADVLSITDTGVLNAIGGVQVNGINVATVSGAQALADKTLTSPAVSGGTIDNAVIGGTTPAAATVTTLTATGQASLGGAAGSESLRAVVVLGATNRIEVNGANGGTPYFITAGSSANIPLNFITKGSGQIGFVTGSAVQQFAVQHTAGANAAITVTGSNGGDPTLSTTSGRVSFGAVPALPSYTVATLPSATSRGLIYVSDGTSNKRLAVADGANWRWPDGAVVS